MDVVALGLAKADAARKYQATPYGLPKVVAHFVGDDLTGSAVQLWPDRSSRGNDLTQPTAGAQGTVGTGLNGHKYAAFGSAGYVTRATAGSGWGEPAGWSQPNAVIAVARFAATSSGSSRTVVGGGVSGHNDLNLDPTGTPVLSAGATGVSGGPPRNDGTWHVFVAVFAPSYGSIYVDGVLVAASVTQSHGSNPLAGLAIGGTATGGTPGNVDVAEVIVCNDGLSPGLIAQITSQLGAKYGITVQPQPAAINFRQVTSSNGQAVRVWLPTDLTGAAAPLILWSHPHAQTEQISPGYFAYPLVQAWLNNGWMVAASNQHANSWGNATALADNLDLYNYVAGLNPVSSLILAGASMGGAATLNAIALSTFTGKAPVKGALLIDGVTDLANMHNNATYTASIDTAYSSNYAVNSVGYDPNLRSAADFGSVPMRFYASSSDTAVPKATHADVFAAKVASSRSEAVVVSHASTHIPNNAAWPADTVAFIKRCLAA